MKINIKILVSVLIVLIWMVVIYKLSAMSSNESNSKSKDFISQIAEKIDCDKDTTSKIKKNNSKKEIINELNTPFRKCAHASVYFVLSFFIMNMLSQIKRHKSIDYLIASIFCFVYACTDEYHQLFVDGRTGQLLDVLIDTIGTCIGCFMFSILYKFKQKISARKIE